MNDEKLKELSKILRPTILTEQVLYEKLSDELLYVFRPSYPDILAYNPKTNKITFYEVKKIEKQTCQLTNRQKATFELFELLGLDISLTEIKIPIKVDGKRGRPLSNKYEKYTTQFGFTFLIKTTESSNELLRAEHRKIIDLIILTTVQPNTTSGMEEKHDTKRNGSK